MDNRRLNRYSLYSAIIFNSLLLSAAVYFFWDVDANAQRVSDGASAEITFYEEGTFTIDNGTTKIKGIYIFTNPNEDELMFEDGLRFKSNQTLILR